MFPIFGALTTSKAGLRIAGCALAGLAMLLLDLDAAAAQQELSNLQLRKADLEVQKLELEVARLRQDLGGWLPWVTAVVGLLVGIAGTATPVWAARRARRGALDQSVHDKRLELYGQLVNATSSLALYFPSVDPVDRDTDQPVPWISPKECTLMGRAMSSWYFEGGGLILSVEARDAYFRLARALTRASLAKELRVPNFPIDVADISVEKVRTYQAELRKLNLDDIENWSFGAPVSGHEQPALRFKDYVFLRRLSSTLRTTLSEDLSSRRRPS
jgi:hypothetical protein